MNIKSTVRFELTLDVEVNSTGKHTLTFDQVNAEAIKVAKERLAEFLSDYPGLALAGAPPRAVHITTLEKP